jgi:two-component system, LytTR family, sensor kinase
VRVHSSRATLICWDGYIIPGDELRKLPDTIPESSQSSDSLVNSDTQTAIPDTDAVGTLALAEMSFSNQATPFSLKDWRLWAASFGFFGALFVCGVFSMLSLKRAGGGSDLMAEEVVILPLIQDIIFAVMAPLVFVVAARYPVQRPHVAKRSLLFMAGGVLFTILHVLLRVLSYPAWNSAAKKYDWALINWRSMHLAIHWAPIAKLFLWNLVEDIFAIYIPILVVAHAVLYYTRYRQRELRSVQLQAQLSDARLLALKSQLQPHFLFNTLHSISSLMLRDVQSADTMIARLSDLLRMSLEDPGEHVTSLKREMEFTQAYLEIEKMRFGDRLSVTFDVPPRILDVLVPQCLLQPLVENSIKYGISKRSSGGEITVQASALGDKLLLSVKDNGPDNACANRDRPVRFGVGLTATRERLRTLYGKNQDLTLDFLSDGHVVVNILIPNRGQARL